MSKIRLGEPIFKSIQGEGNRTGVMSLWIRFFGCNLQCQGFYQDEPTQPATWVIPDVLNSGKKYKSLSDVPILKTGCDSGYSWHPNFKHLAIDYPTTETLLADINHLLYNSKWSHPLTHNMIDLCFTGGEPMMNQSKIIDILNGVGCSDWRNKTKNCLIGTDCPETIQIETNATKPLDPVFVDFYSQNNFVLNWNISPKLFSVSGEPDAVKYDIIQQYTELSPVGCLKFVINSRDESWDELNKHVKKIRDLGISLPVYVMSCGATQEQQEQPGYMAKIADRALREGYHFSGRLHAHIWSNNIGT